jgi:flavin reductase (DIM6/NTAB) family NADH-FMN oxidoreductase RutF
VEIDPATLSTSHRYRWLISLIVPRPIAFVSSRATDGTLNLAPFSFFIGVSADPPVLAIAVTQRSGSRKDTARNILESGEFVVNAAGEDHAAAINRTSGDWDPDIDEFALAGLVAEPSRQVRSPRVRDAAFALECTLHGSLAVGEAPRETTLLLGRIVWMHVRDEVLEEDAPPGEPRVADATRLRPLARLGRNLYTRLGPLLALDRPRGRRPASEDPGG